MARARAFGISTHLFHGSRLGRAHLLDIAAHGFEGIELRATRSHLDYHNPAAVADLQQWLGEAGLDLHSVHAPASETYAGGRPGAEWSLASADPNTRAKAMAEAEHALYLARRLPFHVFVVHLGLPRAHRPTAADHSRDAARRSLDELGQLADPLGVRVAVEVIPNELSRTSSLVHFVERVLEEPVGICLDFGHAHLEGDLVEAIETVSEHLVAVHLHDNHGQSDEHLVPFDGTIDWPAALTAVQKVGFEGPLVLELAARGPHAETLKRAQKARRRLDALLA